MDFQRIALVLGLAIVSYMLVLQWNEDYGQPAQTQQVSSSAVVADTSTALPAEDTVTEHNSDVPTVVEEPEATPLNETKERTSRVIRVVTDTQEILIDTQGGDIIEVQLPQYPVSLEQKDTPLRLMEQTAVRTYTAQSGLIGKDGPDKSSKTRPVYQTAENEYRLADGEDTLSVDLTYSKDNISITKRYIFTRGEYLVQVEHIVDNQTDTEWNANVFAQIKRDKSPDPSKGTSMGMQAYLGAALYTKDQPYTKISFDDMDEGNFKDKIPGGWLGMLQHYFVSAWVPVSKEEYTYQTRVLKNQGLYIIGMTGNRFSVAPGASETVGLQFYAGPKIQDRLGEISDGLELTVDYGWLWFVAQPLFWLLNIFHGLVQNWGLAIILVTIVIKAAFFPLSAASYRSMANMRRVAPKLQELKERYGDDRQKMSQEMMSLYQKEKINPLGGCLPILVQMPVFIALYWVLLESVEIRQAPFMLWIMDLSVKDPFFILPILMGVTMFIQTSLNPTPPDPTQAKVMKMMPIMFTFFFMFFPAGLVLYWLVNNILSIAQQWYINKQIAG
ncbi:membrane protein insertase YidC [Litoribrevibacter albus]|uniref:Membrane protein insertase YidC n=1 Tax=Litoribrevibacter albus TaxID=1473156 RepID=A0AA37SDA1_9GAMM|nr:membrane protein insertase YidC [Litoribrevibacter albus]GLQ32911.1 membrane protein insertase YidC [Litoribrevibacter albus]